MPTQYPDHLDNFINPTASDSLASGLVPHAEQHANLNDAVEAIQTVLGINPAGSYLTIKDRIINTETLLAAQSLINGLSDVTITSATNGDLLKYNGTAWVNTPQKDTTDGGNF